MPRTGPSESVWYHPRKRFGRNCSWANRTEPGRSLAAAAQVVRATHKRRRYTRVTHPGWRCDGVKQASWEVQQDSPARQPGSPARRGGGNPGPVEPILQRPPGRYEGLPVNAAPFQRETLAGPACVPPSARQDKVPGIAATEAQAHKARRSRAPSARASRRRPLRPLAPGTKAAPPLPGGALGSLDKARPWLPSTICSSTRRRRPRLRRGGPRFVAGGCTWRCDRFDRGCLS